MIATGAVRVSWAGDLEALSLEELGSVTVVTASRQAQTLEQAPGTVYVVTRDDIRRNGYLTLQDILVNVPGVQGVNPGFFAVGGQRGFLGSFSQTLLLINGREVQNLIAAEAFIGPQYAADRIERVEVLNGPGSVLYGANALTGVINVITRDADPLFEGVRVNGELADPKSRAASVTFGEQAGDWQVSGYARRSRSEAQEVHEYLSDPAHFAAGSAPVVQQAVASNAGTWVGGHEAEPYAVKVGWREFYVGREAWWMENDKGFENVGLRFDQQFDERWFTLQYAGWQGAVSDHVSMRVEHQAYEELLWGLNQTYSTEGQSLLTAAGRDPAGPLSLTDIDRYFTEIYSQRGSGGSTKRRSLAEVDWHVPGLFDLVAGVDHIEQDLMGVSVTRTGAMPVFDTTVSDANPMRRPSYHSTTDSLFLQARREVVESVAVTVGSRWDDHSNYGLVNTLRGGVVWALSPATTFKALHGEAFREPTIFELGPTRETATELDPSRMRTTELVAMHAFSRDTKGQLTAFYSVADDLIMPGSKIDFINAGDARRHQGVETLWTTRSGPWRLEMAYTAIDPEAGEVGASKIDALNVVEHRLSTGISRTLGAIWTANARINHHSAVDAEHGNPDVDAVIALDDATLCDLTLSWQLPLSADVSADGFFAIRNAFDVVWYQPNVRNTGAREFLQPDRTYVAQMAVRF